MAEWTTRLVLIDELIDIAGLGKVRWKHTSCDLFIAHASLYLIAVHLFLLHLEMLQLFKRQIAIVCQVVCLQLLLELLFLHDMSFVSIYERFEVHSEAIHRLGTWMSIVDGFAFYIQFKLTFVIAIRLDEMLPVVLDHLFLELLPANALVHFRWCIWIWMHCRHPC